MNLSYLLGKMADGQTLTPDERQALMLEARRADEAISVVNSLIKPGSSTIKIENLEASNINIDNGDIVLDNNSIQINVGNGFITLDVNGITLDNAVAEIIIKDSSGNRTMTIYGGNDDALLLQNDKIGAAIHLVTTTAAGSVQLFLSEDPAQDDRGRLDLGVAANGSKFTMGSETSLNGAGASLGATYLQLGGSPRTPPTPETTTNGGVSGHLYVKGGKLICQYEDSGTVRYKYLDLTGTGVTWVHTTSAP